MCAVIYTGILQISYLSIVRLEIHFSCMIPNPSLLNRQFIIKHLDTILLNALEDYTNN
jgi:hypothetical protein